MSAVLVESLVTWCTGQENKPAHVTLKALDWVSISFASLIQPKMAQHLQIFPFVVKVKYSFLYSNKSDLSVWMMDWRCGVEGSSLRCGGLAEWIWDRMSPKPLAYHSDLLKLGYYKIQSFGLKRDINWE